MSIVPLFINDTIIPAITAIINSHQYSINLERIAFFLIGFGVGGFVISILKSFKSES